MVEDRTFMEVFTIYQYCQEGQQLIIEEDDI